MSQNKGWLRLINKKSAALCFLLCPSLAHAALPPQFQNTRDLDVMLSYVKSHPDVLSRLQAIDLSTLTVYYGEGCRAEFTRKAVDRPAGWVGPAATLVLEKSFCPEETATLKLDDTDNLGGITSRDTSSCGAEAIQVKGESIDNGQGCKISTE